MVGSGQSPFENYVHINGFRKTEPFWELVEGEKYTWLVTFETCDLDKCWIEVELTTTFAWHPTNKVHGHWVSEGTDCWHQLISCFSGFFRLGGTDIAVSFWFYQVLLPNVIGIDHWPVRFIEKSWLQQEIIK